jgi:hypothetical protein
MEKEFRYWMGFFGRRFSKFKLYKADLVYGEEFVQRYNPVMDTEGQTVRMNEYVKDLINKSK